MPEIAFPFVKMSAILYSTKGKFDSLTGSKVTEELFGKLDEEGIGCYLDQLQQLLVQGGGEGAG